MSSKRIVCCIRLNTDLGYVYLFNVYMPCDTSNNEHLFEYNMILSDISKCCIDNSISNCIIGGDMNTDMSRICSGKTNSLQMFVAEENLSLALSTVDNSVEHTYIGVNNSTSLIDHLIVSNSIHTNVLDYYTKDSVDNLSDHIPVCINIACIVETVPSNPELVMHCGCLHRAGLFEVAIETTINCFFTDVFGLSVCTMLICEYKDNSM